MTLLTSLQPVRQHSSSTLWRSSFSELKTDVWWLSVNPERLLDLDSPGQRAKSSSTTAHGQPNTSALLLCLLKKGTSGSLTAYVHIHSISIMFDGSLEILNATKNDEGVYTCFAENDRGKANSSGYLTITGQRVYMCASKQSKDPTI